MTQAVVVITGALTGIGEATAKAFAGRGDVVVVSGRHPEVGERLVGDLKAAGAVDAVFVRADVRSDSQVEKLIDTAVTSFGRLDVAVNNAGTEGALAPMTELSEQQYSDSFDTNVLGTLLSLKYELRAMKRQGNGAVVNVTSIYGNKGFANGALYVASKHAVIGLTRSAALEAAAHGVRVNAIGPGFIDTAMFARVAGSAEMQTAFASTIPQGRAGRPDEVAEAILFLTSSQSAYLTGQTLFLDGGVSAG
ncbi:SDR family NAD(P)-dependent oxidoreductase [Mycobacterium sp. HNNTM2301]|uniref:SDR family NAD(P)-dependent oxidoreductase n=1 Tax=Mycobacterium hainanense TaxID=3289775 RepID=UPI0035A6F4B0